MVGGSSLKIGFDTAAYSAIAKIAPVAFFMITEKFPHRESDKFFSQL